MKLKSLAIATCLLILAAEGEPAVWRDMRDATIYIRPRGAHDVLELSWKPAWVAEAHRETIYYQTGAGDLIERIAIPFESTSGSISLPCNKDNGESRLEIPGYSYRYYTIRSPDDAATVFEPVKTHFSMRAADNRTFHFTVPPKRAFSVCAKYHDGVRAISVTDPDGRERRLSLTEFPGEDYPRFNRLALSGGDGAGVWSLKTIGAGKIAFWLDGIPNFFSLRPEDLFIPKLQDGAVKIAVAPETKGRFPLLGATQEFAPLPKKAYDLIGSMAMTGANHYAFQDALTEPDGSISSRDAKWLGVYEHSLGLGESLRLFGPNRKRFPDGAIPLWAAPQYARFINEYLRQHREIDNVSTKWLAFFDEPNSRFASLNEYKASFRSIAKGIREDPNFAIDPVKIVAPESAGLFNGPTKSDSSRRVGAEWLESLLMEDWDLFDAISWHEWMKRDLLGTEWYEESVKDAYSLMLRHKPTGAAEKEIIIGQTNISSGTAISVYEQDTFFAALWWTSVVIQAGQTGKVRMINWLPCIDDPRYKKGLIAEENGQWLLKPAGHAMKFINEHILPEVITCNDNSIELDCIATTNAARNKIMLLLVNKLPRKQKAEFTIQLPPHMIDKETTGQIAILDKNLSPQTIELATAPPGSRIEFISDLPAESIFALEFRLAGDRGE